MEHFGDTNVRGGKPAVLNICFIFSGFEDNKQDTPNCATKTFAPNIIIFLDFMTLFVTFVCCLPFWFRPAAMFNAMLSHVCICLNLWILNITLYIL